ncbi:penicillin-binding protein activator [Burkholderiaceae bacterium DAT-1]|nr:penicillin-binding protein activator [Burkholderiaceae bacterium DAT-1]
MLVRTVLTQFGRIGAVALLYCGMATVASTEEIAQASAPHIAVILPLDAKGLEGPVNAVWAGIQAAESKLGDERTPKVRLYVTGEQAEDSVKAYAKAIEAGAVGMIGPLTRQGVNAIATRTKPEVPVLALNSVEGKPNSHLFSLSLAIEDEARQTARLMYEAGVNRPMVVEGEGPLAKRMREAFAAEWHALAKSAPQIGMLGSTRESYAKLRDALLKQTADAAFLATTDLQARMIRPYLGQSAKVYATSQVWNGKFALAGANLDLAGVRFVDMPWLLDPWHPDNTVFPRAEPALPASLDRLYALGIDAYRLVLLLMVSNPDAAIEMQGVTGTLKLMPDHRFVRDLVAGEIGVGPATAPPEPAGKATDAAEAVSPATLPPTGVQVK